MSLRSGKGGGDIGSKREGPTPEGAIQAMTAAVKDKIKAPKVYENPFLVKGLLQPRRRRNDKEQWGQDALAYSSGGLGDDEHAGFLYAMNRYQEPSFKQ